MKMLNELAKEAYKIAKEHGFHDNDNADNITAARLMLMVSELGEALEADRKDKHADIYKFLGGFGELKSAVYSQDEIFVQEFKQHVKDTYEDELADCLIRILDEAASKGIDLDWHVKTKMKYNSLREFKHGKLY